MRIEAASGNLIIQILENWLGKLLFNKQYSLPVLQAGCMVVMHVLYLYCVAREAFAL